MIERSQTEEVNERAQEAELLLALRHSLALKGREISAGAMSVQYYPGTQ